jgi:hypothetical protein
VPTRRRCSRTRSAISRRHSRRCQLRKPPPRDTLRVALKGPRGVSGTFSILSARANTGRSRARSDRRTARPRRRHGRIGGALHFVWQVEPDLDVDLTATLMLCAIIASVVLGPVLPPDDSTLFGVRGAMERVERLLNQRNG